jgi:hypothetical protein
MRERPELIKSAVVFDELAHTYNYMGQDLSGVTSLLHRTLFANKYNGISQEVLNKAAEYGHNIHEQIELVDSLGVESDHPSLIDYVRIKKENGLVTLANEYLISDDSYIASSIDIVFEVADNVVYVDICDVKTTSKLDMEYLSWQLSIYAYLFERQNPHLKVRKLLALWLPKPRYGKSNLVEVVRKPMEAIKVLIAWDKSIRHTL